MKRYVISAMLTLFMAGCAGNGTMDSAQTPQKPAHNPEQQGQAIPEPTSNDSQARQARQAIQEAEAAAEKADSVGYLWRDTEALIDEAKKAAEEKNYERAIELADEARHQSEEAWRQYLDQRDAGTRN
jgi:hypothetical protein